MAVTLSVQYHFRLNIRSIKSILYSHPEFSLLHIVRWWKVWSWETPSIHTLFAITQKQTANFKNDIFFYKNVKNFSEMLKKIISRNLAFTTSRANFKGNFEKNSRRSNFIFTFQLLIWLLKGHKILNPNQKIQKMLLLDMFSLITCWKLIMTQITVDGENQKFQNLEIWVW